MRTLPSLSPEYFSFFVASCLVISCSAKTVGPGASGEDVVPGVSNGTGGTVVDPPISVGQGNAGSSQGNAGSSQGNAGSSKVDPGTVGSGGSSSGSGGGVCAPLPASAQCGPNPTGAVPLRSMDDLAVAMVHRWILCGRESAFAVDGGDIGIDITKDGHWYKLYLGQNASTVRGAGFDEEGTWESLDLGDHFQVNFHIFGSGTVITAPVFATTPPAMRLDNNGVFRGNYVIDPAIPEGSVRCPAPSDASRSGKCTPAGENAIAIVCPELNGRWARCGGSMPGGPAHDGIELAADGSFFFLHHDANNELVHATDDRATASIDLRSCNGQFNVSLSTASGAMISATAQIRNATPRQLWIFTGPEWGDPERYIFDGPP